MRKLGITFWGLFILYCVIYSQPKADKEIFLNKKNNVNNTLERKIYFGFGQSYHWLLRYNPITLFAASAMYGYQKIISPQISATCLFHPSCSEMSKILIRHYGIFKGTFCTADRLTRCNKVCFTEFLPDDFDPITGKINEGVERYE